MTWQLSLNEYKCGLMELYLFKKLKVHLMAKTMAIDQEECTCLKIGNLGMCFDTCDLDMNLQDGIMTWLLNNYVT